MLNLNVNPPLVICPCMMICSSVKRIMDTSRVKLNSVAFGLKRTYSYSETIKENDEVLVDKIGKIITIGINRPQKRNCVNLSVAQKLRMAMRDFENDENANVAVLYGTGGNFCAGYDLTQFTNGETNLEDLINPKEGPMGPSRRFFKKPVIAAVSGYAVAGGLELALMCDLRVMEETAIMGVYCRRFGVPLIDGGTVRLPAIVGISRALDMILTGRSVSAKEALEWGLANRVVACGTALGQAVNLADSLVKFPQACLLADRISAFNSIYNARSFEEAIAFEIQNASSEILQEAAIGASKFVSGVGRHGKTTNLTDLKVPKSKL